MSIAVDWDTMHQFQFKEMSLILHTAIRYRLVYISEQNKKKRITHSTLRFCLYFYLGKDKQNLHCVYVVSHISCLRYFEYTTGPQKQLLQ